MRSTIIILSLMCLICVPPVLGEECGYITLDEIGVDHTFTVLKYPEDSYYLGYWQDSWADFGGHPYLIKTYLSKDVLSTAAFDELAITPASGTLDLLTEDGKIVSSNVDWYWFLSDSDTAVLQYTISNWDKANFSPIAGLDGWGALVIDNVQGDPPNIVYKWAHSFATPNLVMTMKSQAGHYILPSESSTTYYCEEAFTAPTPTPTIAPPSQIGVNLIEKYSNAILVNQALTINPTSGGTAETKTSLYGQTLYFNVYPGMTYWFNASRPGFNDFNQTYIIPDPPGIYNIYMERILTQYANKSYAHFSIIDQTNGGLVPNAAIVLSDGQSKLSNSAGYSYFLVNNSEQYNYTVSKTGYYLPASGTLNISADTSVLVALQRSTGPTPTWILPSWTPVTVPTAGSGAVPTLSAQLRQQNIQEGMDVWYTNLPFISQFLFLLFIIGGLGLMAGGGRRN